LYFLYAVLPEAAKSQVEKYRQTASKSNADGKKIVILYAKIFIPA